MKVRGNHTKTAGSGQEWSVRGAHRQLRCVQNTASQKLEQQLGPFQTGQGSQVVRITRTIKAGTNQCVRGGSAGQAASGLLTGWACAFHTASPTSVPSRNRQPADVVVGRQVSMCRAWALTTTQDLGPDTHIGLEPRQPQLCSLGRGRCAWAGSRWCPCTAGPPGRRPALGAAASRTATACPPCAGWSARRAVLVSAQCLVTEWGGEQAGLHLAAVDPLGHGSSKRLSSAYWVLLHPGLQPHVPCMQSGAAMHTK